MKDQGKAGKMVSKAVSSLKSEQGVSGGKYTGEKCAKTSGHGSGGGTKGVKGKYYPGGGGK